MAQLTPFSGLNMSELMQQITANPAEMAKQFAVAGQQPPAIPVGGQPVGGNAATPTPLTASVNPAQTAAVDANPQASGVDKFASAAAGVEAPQVNKPQASLSNAPRPGLGGQMSPQIMQLLMQMLGGQGGQQSSPTLGSLIRPAG